VFAVTVIYAMYGVVRRVLAIVEIQGQYGSKVCWLGTGSFVKVTNMQLPKAVTPRGQF